MTMNGGNRESFFTTKGEMSDILQDLIAMGLIGPKTGARSLELKLELMLNDVKLQRSKNYICWFRMAQLILKTKEIQHYNQETCVDPAERGSTD